MASLLGRALCEERSTVAWVAEVLGNYHKPEYTCWSELVRAGGGHVVVDSAVLVKTDGSGRPPVFGPGPDGMSASNTPHLSAATPGALVVLSTDAAMFF